MCGYYPSTAHPTSSGAEIVLEGPGDLLIEQSLKFEFKARNNQAEHETLIAGMNLEHEMGAENLMARSDSQLMTSQITGEYQTKDTQLTKYLAKVKKLAKHQEAQEQQESNT